MTVKRFVLKYLMGMTGLKSDWPRVFCFVVVVVVVLFCFVYAFVCKIFRRQGFVTNVWKIKNASTRSLAHRSVSDFKRIIFYLLS